MFVHTVLKNDETNKRGREARQNIQLVLKLLSFMITFSDQIASYILSYRLYNSPIS